MIKKKNGSDNDKAKQTIARYEVGYRILNKWLSVLQQGKKLTTYFEDNQIRTIAIYGYGDLGKRLEDELKGTFVEVKYGIDKKVHQIQDSKFSIIELERIEEQESVGAIVVTPVQYFWEIERELAKITPITVICLEDIIDYLLLT